jgi:predicted amidohydrolase
MEITIVQYSPVWEKPEENIKRIDALLSGLKEDTDLIVFPEMTLTGFTMHSDKFAEEIDGISTGYFISLAQKLKTNIFAGLIERDGKKVYNSLTHFDRNGLITARYRKIHPFSYSKEDKFYAKGNEPVATKIDKTLFGLSVCYDLRFPELYRLYAKQGAEVLINIANWPIPRIEHWKALLRANAIFNQAFMIGVNRTGDDPFYKYNGNSAIFNPMGENLLLLDEAEQIKTFEINLDEVKTTREKLPFLKDMRLL